MDSLVANLSTTLKEVNNYTDDDIAFAIYKNQLAGWGYFNSPQVDAITQKQWKCPLKVKNLIWLGRILKDTK